MQCNQSELNDERKPVVLRLFRATLCVTFVWTLTLSTLALENAVHNGCCNIYANADSKTFLF